MDSKAEDDGARAMTSPLVECLIEDAFQASVETAICLDEALDRLRSGDASHLGWIQASYSHARAASTSARFAIVAAEDRRRLAE